MRPHKIAHVWDLLDILCMKISRQCGVLFGHASDPDLLFHLPYHQCFSKYAFMYSFHALQPQDNLSFQDFTDFFVLCNLIHKSKVINLIKVKP